jgi:hypothetical protein
MFNEFLRRVFGISIERHQKPGTKQVFGLAGISAIFESDQQRQAADRLFEADEKGRTVPRRRRRSLDNNKRDLGGFD